MTIKSDHRCAEQENQMQSTLQGRYGPNAYRKTAITVGVIYLAGMVLGVGGNILVQSILGAPDHLTALAANGMLVAICALLWLLPAAGDAVFVAVMALLILVQIPLGGEYLRAGTSDTSHLQALSAVLAQGQLYAYH